jgi:hypothetical protein
METDNRIFIDIETIPSPEMPNLEDIKAPANYKDEDKIKAYRKESQLELWKKQALDSMKGQIICIGYTHDGKVDTISLGSEQDTLELFWFRIEEIRNNIREVLHFVGWNITSFDIPWLWRKSMQHDLKGLRNIIPHGNRLLQTDLMKVWAADFKDYVSLDSCAKFLGIEHTGGSGSDVFKWWQDNDGMAIKNHCEQDIKTTMKIYERICG